ncbi:MAG: hypothetical protein Q9170_001471 [Blastenia crenularia]
MPEHQTHGNGHPGDGYSEAAARANRQAGRLVWSFGISQYPIGAGRRQKEDLARILLQDEPLFQDQTDLPWFDENYSTSVSQKLKKLETGCNNGELLPDSLREEVQICLDIALQQLQDDVVNGLAQADPDIDQPAAAREIGSEADGLLDMVSILPGTSSCMNAEPNKAGTAGGTPESYGYMEAETAERTAEGRVDPGATALDSPKPNSAGYAQTHGETTHVAPSVSGPATGSKRVRNDDSEEEDDLSAKRAKA